MQGNETNATPSKKIVQEQNSTFNQKQKDKLKLCLGKTIYQQSVL